MKQDVVELKWVERLTQAGVTNAPWEVRQLFKHLEKLHRKPDSPAGLRRMEAWIKRRCAREPLAYILGEWDFWDLTLRVTPAVLVPRPETEELAGWVLSRWRKRSPQILADVGIGSGALAIFFARHFLSARVYGTDVSPAALRVARKNVRQHGVSRRVTCVRGDLLRGVPPRVSFDVIVANLPYVAEGEEAWLNAEARQEPPGALFGGKDGLSEISRLIPQAVPRLRPGGELVLEVGYQQARPVAQQMGRAGLSPAEIKTDFSGIERFVLGVKPPKPL